MSQAKTILVVDDDHDLRAGLSTVLQENGYRTLEADDGSFAKELIEGQRPDLVILDMMMPRWGGFAVLEQFQGNDSAPPFIMITANEASSHQEDAKKAGVVDFIRKPFTMDRLLTGVARGLAERAAGKKTAEAEDGTRFWCVCPACSARIKAPLQLLGQERPCPRCARPFRVRREIPSDQGPVIALDFAKAPRRTTPH